MYNIKCKECGEVMGHEDGSKLYRNFTHHLKTKYKKLYDHPEFLELIELNKKSKRADSPEKIAKLNEKTRKSMTQEEYDKLCECQICGLKAKQLYKHVHNVHSMSVENYKLQFPGHRLESDEYLEYLSESRKGENNPMFGNGSSEMSPFAIEFYIAKGHSKEDAIKLRDEFKQGVIDSRDASSYTTNAEYYMKKYGVDIITARDMQRDRQTTNSIENIAKREGISLDEAKLIRNDITEKWMISMSSKSDSEIDEINRKKLHIGCRSKGSTKFFDWLVTELNISRESVKYGDDELFFPYTNVDGNRKHYFFDFTMGNNIIEYYGDLFHANPKIYTENDIPVKWRSEQKIAKDIWEYDKLKESTIREHGYNLLVIWESEVKENKYRVLERCREFLLGRKDGRTK
jgi:very-short-patch-repair endonuclease